jgi:DedD protein
LNPLIKQRLVGTVVLVALGVVFWPLIFDSPDLNDPIVLQPMPEKPVIDQTPIAPPESFESIVREALPQAPMTDPEVQQAADESTRTDTVASDLRSLRDAEEISGTTELSDESELVDEQGLPVFWVLQVATVGSSERADELVAGLQKRGYRAFSKRYVRVDDEMHRVQIGPNIDRERLMQMKPQIDSILSVDSQVLRYIQ